jgi:hypothetical protein
MGVLRHWTLARVVDPGGRPRSDWQIGTPEAWSENHAIEVAEVVPADQLRGAVEAGDRLAVMLRASFRVDGYGSPEHEERCREALRAWATVSGGQ